MSTLTKVRIESAIQSMVKHHEMTRKEAECLVQYAVENNLFIDKKNDTED